MENNDKSNEPVSEGLAPSQPEAVAEQPTNEPGYLKKFVMGVASKFSRSKDRTVEENEANEANNESEDEDAMNDASHDYSDAGSASDSEEGSAFEAEIDKNLEKAFEKDLQVLDSFPEEKHPEQAEEKQVEGRDSPRHALAESRLDEDTGRGFPATAADRAPTPSARLFNKGSEFWENTKSQFSNNKLPLAVAAVLGATFRAGYLSLARFGVAAVSTTGALVVGVAAFVATKAFELSRGMLKKLSLNKYLPKIDEDTGNEVVPEFTAGERNAFRAGADAEDQFANLLKASFKPVTWMNPRAYYAGMQAQKDKMTDFVNTVAPKDTSDQLVEPAVSPSNKP